MDDNKNSVFELIKRRILFCRRFTGILFLILLFLGSVLLIAGLYTPTPIRGNPFP